jgi:hypothetical protein
LWYVSKRRLGTTVKSNQDKFEDNLKLKVQARQHLQKKLVLPFLFQSSSYSSFSDCGTSKVSNFAI